MRSGYKHTVVLLIVLNYTIFGITFFNAQSPILRISQHAFTFVLAALWLFALWRKGKSLPHTPLDLPLVTLAIAWAVAALASLDPRVSLEYLWPILIAIMGLYWFVELSMHQRERWVSEALFLTGAVIVVISLLEEFAWYTGTPMIFGFSQGWPDINGITLPPVRHRLLFLLNGTNGLGTFTAMLVPLAITWATTTRKRDLGFGAAVLAGGLVLVVVFSGSRGALMGLFVSSAILLLTWLRTLIDRPSIPQWLASLARPRVFFGLAAVAAITLAGAILLYTLTRPLRSGDANRIDLWQSAIAMTRDHPLTGVGPFQFGHAQRLYGNPEVAENQARHTHAHNIILQTLAEGGLIVGLAALWVLVAFARSWWTAWQAAPPPRRRRLEGGLAALAGFAAHNMVDTFTQIHYWVPVLFIVAYTLSPYATPITTQRTQRRHLTAGLLALLIVAELAFVPVHLADLAHGRVQQNLSDLPTALAEAQKAQQLDPYLALYQMDEAYVLGLLAEDAPDQYLDAAILAHEESLSRNSVWEIGWHNLASLYARSGQLEQAIEAEQHAIDLLPGESGFHFVQGRYYEQLGNTAGAIDAYSRAIWHAPNLITSGFWSDPTAPDRTQMLETIVALLLEDPEVSVAVAIQADMLEIGIPFAETVDVERASIATLVIMGEWATQASHDPAISEEMAICPECYSLEALERGVHRSLYYVRLAELALQNPEIEQKTGYTAEQLAKIALFIGTEASPRAWYVLAQIAEQQNAPEDTINQYLRQAVPAIVSKQEYPTVVFGRKASFDILPSAQYPVRFESQYMPWLWLAERYEMAGDTENLVRVYEAILAGEPYAWDIREQLATITQSP